MTSLPLSTLNFTPRSFRYAVEHVFLPVELSDGSAIDAKENELSLARAVCTAAYAYTPHICKGSVLEWERITAMLYNLQAYSPGPWGPDGTQLVSQLHRMQVGDILVFPTEYRKGAVILRKREHFTLFELFQLFQDEDTKNAVGPFVRSYPEFAIEAPNRACHSDFARELADSLDGFSRDEWFSQADRQRYIKIHTGVLQLVGQSADVPPITKHVRHDAHHRWSRSRSWLLTKVVLHMSMCRSLGPASYKEFMLFFICIIAKDANSASLSSDLLHLITSKILRRSAKLGSSIPGWLSELALQTCARFRELLDARRNWMPLRASSSFWNPSQDNLQRDTQLSFLHSREHISNALVDVKLEAARAPFHPSHHRRGAIDDFLSSNGAFFEEAYKADSGVTLYDVEQAVEHGIDDWFSSVTDVDDACRQLGVLIDKYIERKTRDNNPEAISIMVLTVMELFVMLDQLTLKKIPMLADYSPEIPCAALERLLLRKATDLHRLSRSYQYLWPRHTRSRPGWSILSCQFTEESFPVRYYNQSTPLQQLKTQIEEENAGTGIHTPLLPKQPLLAKVIVFELQCPSCIHIWRSVVSRILHIFSDRCRPRGEEFQSTPADGYESNWEFFLYPRAIQRHLINLDELGFCAQIRLAYFRPLDSEEGESPRDLTLCYMLDNGGPNWVYHNLENCRSFYPSYELEYSGCSSCRALKKYIRFTSHDSNHVLAAQVDCPKDLSVDEFITFGQLRSSGSLQWLNILRGLCTRTLNLRCCHSYFLLCHAVLQAGPLDLNTGTWIWHQELHDATFCSTLLDELENRLVDIGADLIDGIMMNAISLLVTKVVESSPREDISKRAIAILRRLRRRTFSWVQELSYNLAQAPTNEERRNALLDMAATCRGTLDVGPVALRRSFDSAEDVDVVISCGLFVRILNPGSINDLDAQNAYRQLLIQRDLRIAFDLEEASLDVILADVSDYGIDLAVGKIFSSHKPGATRWERVADPNAGRWLSSQIKATVPKTVHLNLLDGQLQVDGRQLGGLPPSIRDDSVLQTIFRHQGFFVVPSNLPGMDFTTLVGMSEYKVHFSMQDGVGSPLVRAQHGQSKDVLELIPSNSLQDDLPPTLIKGYVHWLNLSTRTIEICPLKRLWERSQENWRIDCGSEQYRAYKGCETLVDIRSPTWRMVSQCFRGLNTSWWEKDSDLLLTASRIDPTSEVLRLCLSAPTHCLSFFANDRGELESCDFKDMVYDENQCIGTLYGLRNLLVLRHKTHLTTEGLVPRCILIPNGIPRGGEGQLGELWLETLPSSVKSHEPSYHTYDVDADLRCLRGSGSLKSARFLAYLHAFTSRDTPDQLTGITGIQAACIILQSAGCRSVMKLKALDVDVEDWSSMQYPQINVLRREIIDRYYWSIEKYRGGRSWMSYEAIKEEKECVTAREKRAAQRAAYLFPCHAGSHRSRSWPVTLDQLLSDRAAPELPSCGTFKLPRNSYRMPQVSDDMQNLEQLLSSDSPSPSTNTLLQEKYIARLRGSAQRARAGSQMTHALTTGHCTQANDTLREHYMKCREKYLASMEILKNSLGPKTKFQEFLEKFGQWPPITADTLLRCLASTSPIKIPGEWKKCLISFALLLLDLQRARRLFRLTLDGLKEEFSTELGNEVCDGWNPEDRPDWLLIQIQGNFLIRRAQAEIANEMISPESGRNTMMQVNIGEGKSSVIIPIIAAVVSNGKQLARVIVPKALTVQMFDLLVARLGGLANRPIYHLPFSRSAGDKSGGSVGVDDLHKLMSRCLAERGVIIVQPEHVVSLKLMSIEKQLDRINCVPKSRLALRSSTDEHFVTNCLPSSPGGSSDHLSTKDADVTQLRNDSEHCAGAGSPSSSDTASNLLDIRMWIDSHVRDILDESDEILHPRFQLIYSIGLQKHVDGHPDRWIITQQILRLAKKHICTFVGSRHSSESPGWFPHTPIERASEVGKNLISWIVEDVMTGWLPGFSFHGLHPTLHDAIYAFISREEILQVTVAMVEEYAKKSYMWNVLLLLRGLLASKILRFALVELRWRIDYGLISQSSYQVESLNYSDHAVLAVPYRAKDVPAPNAQFGHPDTAIILTCLSYYYGGLNEGQLRASFQILLKEDDPITEYAVWVEDFDEVSLPQSLRELREINLNSSEQWDNITYPLFHRNQGAIDFYLSRVVFPQEAKEFPWKISTSNWDLVEERENVITTGFSGTDDARWLFPLSVTHRDLEHQQGTCARLLAYLLRPENNFYMVTEKNIERETRRLLECIAEQRPENDEIRVLLDVGGQVLNLSNRQVAEAWLDVACEASGAIYFNNDDELVVITRDGTTVTLASSPLSQQLHRCVIYLDHAHTRGTDIKIPLGSRAAVTLGLKLTKDALVQGCMRMRKLGHGHSIMFFAPPEVDESIRTLAAKTDPNSSVTTIDVIRWAIRETLIDLQQRAPYWARQGISHRSKRDAWVRLCGDEITAEQLSEVWLESDHKSLEDLYAPHEPRKDPSTLLGLDPGIQQRCEALGILTLPSAQLDEQQEREVHREREREREAELPPKAEAAEHSLHPDVVAFVKEGVVPLRHPDSPFRPIFAALTQSSAAACEAEVWSPLIFATADFCNTIKPESTQGTVDQYLRPVQWVLSSRRDRSLVLLSPFEADHLLPDLGTSEYVYLHLYAPRTSQRMRPSDDLRLYSIPRLPPDWTPPWDLIDQLNVFAGQLYLRDYDAYLRFCDFLNISPNKRSMGAHGFETRDMKDSSSLLSPVMTLLTIRNRGQPFTRTHMEKMQRGQWLTEKDFEGLRQARPAQTSATYSDNGKSCPPQDTNPPDTAHNFSREGQTADDCEKLEFREKREPKAPASSDIRLAALTCPSSSSGTAKDPLPSLQLISKPTPAKFPTTLDPPKSLSSKGKTTTIKSIHKAGLERSATSPQKSRSPALNVNSALSAASLPPSKTQRHTASQLLEPRRNSQTIRLGPSTNRQEHKTPRAAPSTPPRPSTSTKQSQPPSRPKMASSGVLRSTAASLAHSRTAPTASPLVKKATSSCDAANRQSKPTTVPSSKVRVKAAAASPARAVKSASIFVGTRGSAPPSGGSSKSKGRDTKEKVEHGKKPGEATLIGSGPPEDAHTSRRASVAART